MVFPDKKLHIQIPLVVGFYFAFSLSIQANDTLKVNKPSLLHLDKTVNDSLTVDSISVNQQPEKNIRKQKIRKHKALYNPLILANKRYNAKLDSLIQSNRNSSFYKKDLLINPYYFPLMGSSTLYYSTLQNKMGFSSLNKKSTSTSTGIPSSKHIYDIIDATDTQLTEAYSLTPWFVRYQEESEGTLNVDKEIKESIKSETTLTEHYTQELSSKDFDLLTTKDLGIIVRKPNFWTFKTNFSFQFTQNYVTDNWYKGGESHNALLAATNIEANFDNKQRITFDNRLEMKLGFQTSHDDLKHKFKTNSDLLRLTNKLGLNAIQDWYYTIMLQSWTQFYKGYKPNDPKVYSDFMAPFVSLLSLGMDYKKVSKNKKFNITATVSPIALKFQYVKRPELVSSFGHDPGKKVKWEYGSNITISYNWSIWQNISWVGRFYFFSDYSKSQIEWENTFNFAINKYLSTRLFLYPRFDDAIARKPDDSYFQFNELLSLGLNFNF